MRTASSFFSCAGAIVVIAGCGGSVATVPSSSEAPSPPGSGSGAGNASSSGTIAPTPTAPVGPASPGSGPACSFTGAGQTFASAADLRMVIDGAWDACTSASLCPVSDPHFFVDRSSNVAVCASWCGGDGGVCPTRDATYRFTYDVVFPQADGAPALALTSQDGTRRYAVRGWPGNGSYGLLLTDLDTAATLGLERVGVPVK